MMHLVFCAPDGRCWGLECSPEDYYWWFHGNASCDCNRAAFVNAAHDTDYDEDRCGDTWSVLYVVGDWAIKELES